MSLRALKKTDLKQILSWRNSDYVRLNMFSQEPISLENHFRWFERVQPDKSSVWWLYTDLVGKAAGVVYFTEIDDSNGTCFWGFYIDPESIKGTGSNMGREALDKAFDELGLRKIYGDVLEFNTVSQGFHEKLGFKKEGSLRKHHRLNGAYYDVIRYGLLEDEWSTYDKR